MKLRKKQARSSAPPDMRLLILCICCLIGMLAAWPVHRGIGSDALTQLSAYVQSYAQLADGRVQQPASVLSTAAAYLRCPLLAFLCGLSAAGVVLIPALCMAQGFCLSFSVCCFAASLGHEGVLLALAALGLRCLFVLPCMLCISRDGFSRACRALSQKHPVKSEIPWRMLLFCVFVLLTGTVVECAIVPKFFALILARLP